VFSPVTILPSHRSEVEVMIAFFCHERLSALQVGVLSCSQRALVDMPVTLYDTLIEPDLAATCGV